MSQLATINRNTNGAALDVTDRRAVPPMGFDEIWRIAEAVAKGGLMPGAKTPEQAFTLMLICHADGLHPIDAIRRFHVIEGRPSMRADAIQADFQARGGRVQWLRSDAEVCEASFTHPRHHPEPFVVRVEMSRFIDNKVAMTYDEKRGEWRMKKTWASWPDAMLRARVISAGVRAVDPGVIVGMSSEEEVRDVITLEQPEPLALVHERSKLEAAQTVTAADIAVPGQPEGGFDSRPYHLVASAAADFAGVDAKGLHGHLLNRAIQLGLCQPPKSRKSADVIATLSAVYKSDRDWLRTELAAFVATPPGAGAEPAAKTPTEQPPADLGWVHGGNPESDPLDHLKDQDGAPEPGSGG